MVRKIYLCVFLVNVIFGALLSAQGFAQYELKEITPAVQKALESRKARYEKLSEFKSNGTVGENNKGYLTLLKDHELAGELVDMENRDRSVIYKAIATQNNIEEAISTIEKVFGEVQREKAQPGEKIQSENGEWKIK